MLEQAVIDAQALKEAAIKNAEQEVMDKYAGEIKEAVNSLLEQEDPMAADPMADPMAVDPMADPMAAGGEEEGATGVDKITDDLPLKALDGLNVNGMDDGEEIELDLDALIKSMKTGEETEAPGETQMMFEATDADLHELLDEEHLEELDESEDLDEEIEFDEDTLKQAIAEILKVDLENVPRGMPGTTHPTKTEQIYAVEVAAAGDEENAAEEEKELHQYTKDLIDEKLMNKKALKQIEKLEEQVKSLKSGKNRLVKEHKELKSIARQVSNKLIELNIANAKLVYQNRILESHSLNERQKEKLVEAVSNANSTEEAKVIYETLHESLSFKSPKGPQNLSEAVSKNNWLILKSNKKETQVSNSASERMKKLAGII